MQMPESRLELVSRVVLALLLVVVLVVALALFVGSRDTSGTAVGGGSDGTSASPGLGDRSGEVDAEEAGPEFDSVFDTTTAEAGEHRFELSVSTDGDQVGYQYLWRDNKNSSKGVTASGSSTRRQINAAQPGGLVWIQLGVGGGRASCRASVDGRTAMTKTITKPYQVAFCVA